MGGSFRDQRERAMFKLAAVMALCALSGVAQAQTKSDKEVRTEFDQAEQLLKAQNFVGALPLYEDLHQQRPDDMVYDERLAMCLLAQASSTGLDPQKAQATEARAKSLMLEAQKRGDNSPLLVTLLEKLDNRDEPTMPAGPPTAAQADFTQAEKLFSSGDLQGALNFYKKALDEDPQYYAAALYAGDSLFKIGDCPQAGVYYAKAVAINPNEEQAFRYWGDCLVKQHDKSRAEEMYIKAVIAQPYQKTTRQSLKAFAESNHMRIAGPPITLPKRAEPDANGKININLDMTTLMSPAASAWILYLASPAVWQKSEFAKNYPNEKQYRHSLAEEAESIRDALSFAKKSKIDISKDTTLKLLAELDGKGMLECWILLDGADNGIAQDYVAYRKDHRDLMAKYMAQYDVHPM